MKQQELEDDFWSCNVITSDDLMPSESKDLSQMTQRQLEDEVEDLTNVVSGLMVYFDPMSDLSASDIVSSALRLTNYNLIIQDLSELITKMRKNRE